jgi:hypothetical protein
MNTYPSEERFTLVRKFMNYYKVDKDTKITDVPAGTEGKLQQILRNAGYIDIISIDPEIKKLPGIISLPMKLSGLFAATADIIVSIHPCKITEEVISLCRKFNTPLIILPCFCEPLKFPEETRITDFLNLLGNCEVIHQDFHLKDEENGEWLTGIFYVTEWIN